MMPAFTRGGHLADELERIIALHDGSSIAAVIVEPVAGASSHIFSFLFVYFFLNFLSVYVQDFFEFLCVIFPYRFFVEIVGHPSRFFVAIPCYSMVACPH